MKTHYTNIGFILKFSILSYKYYLLIKRENFPKQNLFGFHQYIPYRLTF